MKIKKIAALMLAYSSVALALTSCAAEKTPATSCAADGKQYFHCATGPKIYTLCAADKNTLAFIVEENKQSTLLFQGDAKKQFTFSNYHRFKVTQNTVEFTAKDNKIRSL